MHAVEEKMKAIKHVEQLVQQHVKIRILAVRENVFKVVSANLWIMFVKQIVQEVVVFYVNNVLHRNYNILNILLFFYSLSIKNKNSSSSRVY